jgi:Ca2+-binding RTX toxin-like protein
VTTRPLSPDQPVKLAHQVSLAGDLAFFQHVLHMPAHGAVTAIGLAGDFFDGQAVHQGRQNLGFGLCQVPATAEIDNILVRPVHQKGTNTLYGNRGNDTLAGGAGVNQLYGGKDDDSLTLGTGGGQMFGGSGDDVLDATASALQVNAEGGSGDDDITGSNAITGDTLFGGTGNDTIRGGTGADLIHGEQGDDTLYGGTQADWFYFAPDSGYDVIKDFENGTDYIVLENLGLSTFADFSGLISYAAGNSIIDLTSLGVNTVIVVENSGILDSTDFLYV